MKLMAELELDYQQHRPFPWMGAALLMLALAAVIVTGAYYFGLKNRIASGEAKLEQIKGGSSRAAAASRAAEHVTPEMAEEVKQANEVLRKLTMPWEKLFQAVEAPAGKDVTLLALAPDAEKQVVKINGEAKDFDAVLQYITDLEEREEFGQVYLQSHQVQQQDPDKPVRFSLLATWRDKL